MDSSWKVARHARDSSGAHPGGSYCPRHAGGSDAPLPPRAGAHLGRALSRGSCGAPPCGLSLPGGPAAPAGRHL